MARANGVDVELLHQLNVLDHRSFCNNMARHWVMFMTIDTLDQYGLTVHQQLPIFYFRGPEADLGACRFNYLTRVVA